MQILGFEITKAEDLEDLKSRLAQCNVKVEKCCEDKVTKYIKQHRNELNNLLIEFDEIREQKLALDNRYNLLLEAFVTLARKINKL